MKVLFCIISVAVACSEARRLARQIYPQQPPIPILSFVNENNYDGSYRYSYSTGNGIQVQEQGYLKNPGQRDLEAQTAQGSYSYTAPDGTPITLTWYADETGFHAEGAHLPTPPPIPAGIARALAGAPAGPAAQPSYFQG